MAFIPSLFARRDVRGRQRQRPARPPLRVEALEDRVTPTAGWAINFAAAEIYSLAADDAGNVYAASHFSGTVDFDPGPGVSTLTSAGGSDGYLAKYAPDGSFLWVRNLGGSTDDVAWGVATFGDAVY